MSEGVYGNQVAGRITHGLLRLSTAMRSQAWEWAEGAGLTPTQGEILVLLMQRKGPLRLNDIARETALTAATTSDAVTTLETKGLVEKRRALDDGRALAVKLTTRGRTAAKRALQWPQFLSTALHVMPGEEQAAMYRGILKMIGQLEKQGNMPLHRMCPTCAHFEPGRAPTRGKPGTLHHCTLLEITYGDDGLRLDCPVHQEADAMAQRKIWKIFAKPN